MLAHPPTRVLDHEVLSPSLHLATDEVLLESVSDGTRGDALLLWESDTPFVVLGTSQRIAAETNESACAEDGVPIRRRCSAGGCVLQGPGSLNFTLALRLEAHPDARSLHASYQYLLSPLREAFHENAFAVEFAGLSDLVLDGRKISGNAQRRKRNAILHHGTLLYAPDYSGMARYLREPQDRPEYRGARTHEEFVGRVPMTRAELEALIARAYGVAEEDTLTEAEAEAARRLAADKYDRDAWTRRR